MDFDDEKTKAAGSRTALLIAMSNVETRCEQLQKKVLALADLSDPGIPQLRNELRVVLKQLERAIEAADAITKKSSGGSF